MTLATFKLACLWMSYGIMLLVIVPVVAALVLLTFMIAVDGYRNRDRHWKLVPSALQREVWKHYRPGQEIDKRPSAAYIAAMRRAIAAVAEAEAARPATRTAPSPGLFGGDRNL